jgi:hypothetical protein
MFKFNQKVANKYLSVNILSYAFNDLDKAILLKKMSRSSFHLACNMKDLVKPKFIDVRGAKISCDSRKVELGQKLPYRVFPVSLNQVIVYRRKEIIVQCLKHSERGFHGQFE